MSGKYQLRKSYGRRNRVKVGFRQSTVRKIDEVPTLNFDEISQNLNLPDFMLGNENFKLSMQDLRQLSYEIIKES